jgi:hypothetical protein
VSKKRKLTQRQQKLVKNLAAGMNQSEAAAEAGYSDKNLRQSAHQALQQIQRRMPELFEELGLTDRAIIEKHLIPLLNATEAKFFPYRKQIVALSAEGKRNKQIDKDLLLETVQVIDVREIAALGTRIAALDIAFKLKGSYAPRQFDVDPKASVTVQVIDVSAIPRHG